MDNLAVNKKLEARLARITATNKEIEVIPLYHKLRRRHYSFGPVSAVISIQEPFTLKTSHFGLVAKCTICRPAPETFSGHHPIAEIIALEIRKHNVIPLGTSSQTHTNRKYSYQI
jgi:hypothetical protein